MDTELRIQPMNESINQPIKVFVPSIRSQWPVRIHTHTIMKERQKDMISAAVKRPHMPNEILKPQMKE
jgi:hypothetical protein